MKKSEIDELKKAFNIPEPERKEEFLSSLQFKIKKNNCRSLKPMILRYCSAVTAAAVVAGLWSGLKSVKELSITVNNSDRTIQTEPETVQNTTATHTSEDNSTPVSRPFDDNETTTTTVKPVYTEQPEIILPPVYSDENTENYHQPAITTNISAATEAVTTTTMTTAKNSATSSNKTTPVTTLTAPITTTKAETTTKRTITTTTSVFTNKGTTTTTTALFTTKSTTTTTKPTTFPPFETTTYNCSTEATTTTAPAGGNSPDIFSDYRIIPEKIYSKSDSCIELDDFISAEPPHESGDSWEGSAIILSLTALVYRSDAVLSGYVEDIIYTQCGGMPYTQVDIMVKKSYKSEKLLNYGDMISVYIPGGYMSAADFLDINGIADEIPRDGTVFYQGGNSGKLKTGSDYIFFLNIPKGTIPDGAYILTDNTDSNVFIRNNAGEYESLNYADRKFLLSELFNVIQNMNY